MSPREAIAALLRTALVAAPILGSCATPSDLLLDLPCPCATGWYCDESRSPAVCVEGSGMDSGVADSDVADSDVTDSDVTDSDVTDSDVTDSDVTDSNVDSGTPPPPPVSTACWRGAEPCDWTGDSFSFEEVMGSGGFTDYKAANAAFSPDGCSIYYAMYVGGDYSLWRVDRPGPGMPFGTPVALDDVNDPASDEDAPSVGPDRLELFFASNRGPSGLRRVHRSTRMAMGDAWGTPAKIPALDVADTVAWEPRVAPHGLRLYYARKLVQQWINVSERAALGGSFGPAVPLVLDGITPAYATNRPSVTQSDRVLVGVQQPLEDRTGRRAFYSTRLGWNDPWDRVRPVPTSIGAMGMRDIGVSADGCELLVRDLVDRAALLLYTVP